MTTEPDSLLKTFIRYVMVSVLLIATIGGGGYALISTFPTNPHLQRIAKFVNDWRIERLHQALLRANPDFGSRPPEYYAVGFSITTVYLPGRKVKDLSPMADMSLAQIILVDTQVSDVSCLAGTPLKSLTIINSPFNDLSSLKGMRLTELFIEFTDVSDLTPLVGMPLLALGCPQTQVADLTPLKGMPLKQLDIRGTPAAELPLPAWLDPTKVRIEK